MKRRTLFATISLAAAERSPWTTLRRLADDAVARQQVPGAVIAIAHDGRTVFTHATGAAVLEPHRALRPNDIFMIASSSKPIAATAILTLVHRGRLRLEDRVDRFFPGSPITATIRQLLSHTSGIFGNDAAPELVASIRDFNLTLHEAVQRIVRVPPQYEPGGRFSYGGASFCVAGGIVELITGQDFETFIRREVFAPLGMTDTCYRSAADLSPRVPVIYDVARSFQPIRSVMETPERRGPRPDGFVLVPGGIYSTAADLLRFLSAHLREDTLLSPALFAEMRRKQTGALPVEYGLGWYRYRPSPGDDAASVGHGGAYGTDIWIDRPRRLAVAVLTQTRGQSTPTLQQSVRDAIDRLFPLS